MSDFLQINGTADQVSSGDVYGFFRTIFNDGYFLTNIGAIDDNRLLGVASLFGKPWNTAEPTLTVAKTENPKFVAQTDSIIEAHNECAYSEAPPRLLLLYCVENETEGGNFFTVFSTRSDRGNRRRIRAFPAARGFQLRDYAGRTAGNRTNPAHD